VNEDHNARNRASRERLRHVGERLGDHLVTIADDWTAAGLLAHLAFWERMTLLRWERHQREAVPLESIDDRMVDLVNAAAKPQWNETAPRRALADVMAAAEAVDALIEKVGAAEAAQIAATRPRLVDRSLHRSEHLEEIERALI
jgi:hypothetical protein